MHRLIIPDIDKTKAHETIWHGARRLGEQETGIKGQRCDEDRWRNDTATARLLSSGFVSWSSSSSASWIVPLVQIHRRNRGARHSEVIAIIFKKKRETWKLSVSASVLELSSPRRSAEGFRLHGGYVAVVIVAHDAGKAGRVADLVQLR